MLDELVAAVLTNGVVALSSLQAPKRAADRSAPLKAKEIREILCISKNSLFYPFKFIFVSTFLQVNFFKMQQEWLKIVILDLIEDLIDVRLDRT